MLDWVKRSAAVFAAWWTGWLIYMAAMLSDYDGILSLIFQPIMAALCSSLFTGAALLCGLALRIPVAGGAWRSSHAGPLLMIGISMFVLCFGTSLGWTQTYTTENGTPAVTLRPELACAGYFGVIFAIANWPVPRNTV